MVIKVPATSANLGPGFDALGLSLNLFNIITINESPIFCISLNGEGSQNLNLKKHNMFISIFNEITRKFDTKLPNFRFVFENNIPFSRGLGSSSAVIVGAIASAYKICGIKIDKNKILNEALVYENHPDNIAPAAFGGFVSSVIYKNSVITQKSEIGEDIKAVVVIPDKQMQTRKSRTMLPKNFTIKECVANLSHAAFLTSCFVKKDYKNLKFGCIDVMHEELRMQNLPELFEVRKIAYENGALMSSLSGSGSSFLNIVYKDDAKNLATILSAKFPKFTVKILDFDNGGFAFE